MELDARVVVASFCLCLLLLRPPAAEKVEAVAAEMAEATSLRSPSGVAAASLPEVVAVAVEMAEVVLAVMAW